MWIHRVSLTIALARPRAASTGHDRIDENDRSPKVPAFVPQAAPGRAMGPLKGFLRGLRWRTRGSGENDAVKTRYLPMVSWLEEHSAQSPKHPCDVKKRRVVRGFDKETEMPPDMRIVDP